MPTIALVDDDRNILTSVSIALEAEGYRIMTYTDGASALDGFKTSPPDLAILDIKMPRMDGMETLRTDMERFYQDNRSYAGATGPCATTRSLDAFDLSCTGTLDNKVYTIQATGKGLASGFTYTVNQINERFTTAVPAGRGYNRCTTASNGWMLRKGQACPS